MARTLKQSHPLPRSEAEEKLELLKQLRRLAQQNEAQCFSIKTAKPVIMTMKDDPQAALAFLQECGIYNEHGELAAPYR